MSKKNRFSILLEELMSTADLKNYTLAKELQYDVSYISKWVSGRMLPSEKNLERILKTTSHCVVASLTEKTREGLYQDYQVDQVEDLEEAIYDNLIVEYNYVKHLKDDLGAEIAPKTSYFPELTLLQFISKMRHPVLRKVKSLKILAVIDILAMEHEYRLMIADIEGEQLTTKKDRKYFGVHFSMLIDLESGKQDCVCSAIFLMNMLTNCSNVDLQLYGSPQAHGKAIFLVKDLYSISGMLIDRNSCIAVTTSEDSKDCNVLYHKIKTLCRREMLLFRKIDMKEMLEQYDYIQSMLSKKLRWLIGHMTEHFFPKDLFEELLLQTNLCEKWGVSCDKLRQIHSVTNSILKESPVQIMVYESAFTDFAVSGKLDFYNYSVVLTPNQRIQYMRNILDILEKNNHFQIKLICGRFVSDFQYIANPCLFLSDTISYLRLDNKNYQNNTMALNGISIKTMFSQFLSEIWNNRDGVVLDDRNTVKETIKHMIESIELLSRMEKVSK